MAARLLPRVARALPRTTSSPTTTHTAVRLSSRRAFHASSRLLETPVVNLPVRKPVGAFRGGLLGFLTGSTLTGAGVYYYVLEEYKVSNELLTEDIYALQSAVQRIHTYVQSLEEKVEAMEKRKK